MPPSEKTGDQDFVQIWSQLQVVKEEHFSNSQTQWWMHHAEVFFADSNSVPQKMNGLRIFKVSA